MKSKILNSKGQILQNKEIVWTNLGRLKLFLVFLGIILFFVFFIMNSIDNRQIEYDLIKNNNQIISGKIIKISLYKGHHVRVQFKVKDITYTGSDGFDTMEGKEVGDSIYIKYYVKDPNIFITELNDEFGTRCPPLPHESLLFTQHFYKKRFHIRNFYGKGGY